MAFIPPTPDRIDTGNSSTTPLTGGATFTGTAVDVTTLPIGAVTVFAFSDVASAANGLQLQWSQDNVVWTDHSQNDTIAASSSGVISDKPRARYYRVVYTNGTSPQGAFRLQTIQSVTNTSGTVRDLDTLVQGDDEAQLTRSILTGRSAKTGVFNNVGTDSYGSIPILFSPPASDAFGRARVASPQTLFNVSFEYDAQPLLMQIVNVGGGTSAKTSNISTVTLNTGGTTNGDGSIFQSKQYSRYEPGKSLLISMTGVIGAAKANVRSQIGYYDANNGMFFDQNNGMNVTIRTHTSGSPVDTAVAQASWNIDKMNGTGPSGVTLDFTKEQIFLIDLQWLGAGRVRFGFIVDGLLYYAHEFLNANSLIVPYTNTACLPIRWEIHNTGTAASGTTMTAGCGSVIAEGGNDVPSSLQFSVTSGTTGITAGNGTRTPILSIRPKTTFNSIANRSRLVLLAVALSNTNQGIIWELVYNGTLTGPSFASVDANSGVESDHAASAITGGTVIASGFNGNSGANKITLSEAITSKLPFTLDAAGSVQDIFTLCMTGLGGTAPSWASMDWSEER